MCFARRRSPPVAARDRREAAEAAANGLCTVHTYLFIIAGGIYMGVCIRWIMDIRHHRIRSCEEGGMEGGLFTFFAGFMLEARGGGA